jgi:phenylalanyl-tRNA synthetase alpha chain
MKQKPKTIDQYVKLAIETVLPEHRLIKSSKLDSDHYLFEYAGFIDEINSEAIQNEISLLTKEAVIDSFSYDTATTLIKVAIKTDPMDNFVKSIFEIKQQAEVDQKNPDFHQMYLGKKGRFNDLAKSIKDVEAERKGDAGKLLNDLKKFLESLSTSPTTNHPPLTTNEFFDPTIPGTLPPLGHLHPISQAIRQISTIFENIGFVRARYPEVDWDKYVFENLNMPKNHPARDEWETFFIEAPKHPQMGQMVLTTHTSNGQTREMERVKTPPVRMLNIAKCYRRQQDVTHTAMFHQFEGLVIDQGINIQHLKGVLDHFAKEFYGPQAKSRIRPFHFQFTEPSFEVDFSCIHCNGTGCRFCKSGWHEVGGAGMVHPNVLTAGGIDPKKYTGFAFGWGVERVYTLKPGLQLDDIRPLYSNNLDFLGNF